MAGRPPQAPAVRKLQENESSEIEDQAIGQTGPDYTQERYRQDDAAIEDGIDPGLLPGELQEGHALARPRLRTRHQPEHRGLAQAGLAPEVATVWKVGPR